MKGIPILLFSGDTIDEEDGDFVRWVHRVRRLSSIYSLRASADVADVRLERKVRYDYAKLKANMTELDGPIQTVAGLPRFTEAPWVHEHNGWYYLSYATEFPEKIAYSMSRSLEGPWEYKGILNELAGNSNTNHQAIIDFKGRSYFIYHNGGLDVHGGSFRRSVCADYLTYNKDGTMQRVRMTTEGVQAAK